MVAEANEADRVLLVEVLSGEQLAPVLAGERAGHFALEHADKNYPVGNWDLVSHNLAIQEDGSVILSTIYVRNYSGDSVPQEPPHLGPRIDR